MNDQKRPLTSTERVRKREERIRRQLAERDQYEVALIHVVAADTFAEAKQIAKAALPQFAKETGA